MAGADDAITTITNKGMSLLDNRNKLNSIADRDGWDVVEYFEVDPLTKNDEEEKKLGNLASHIESWIFACMSVTFWLILYRRKKLLFIAALVVAKQAISSRIVKFPLPLNDYDFDEFSECGKAELDTGVFSVFWIRGRLHKFLHVCRSIGASSFVLSIIESSYKLPFLSIPVKCFFNNHKSTVDNRAFVCEAIEQLLLAGSMVEVNGDQVHVCSPLGVVPKKNGKL